MPSVWRPMIASWWRRTSDCDSKAGLVAFPTPFQALHLDGIGSTITVKIPTRASTS